MATPEVTAVSFKQYQYGYLVTVTINPEDDSGSSKEYIEIIAQETEGLVRGIICSGLSELTTTHTFPVLRSGIHTFYARMVYGDAVPSDWSEQVGPVDLK